MSAVRSVEHLNAMIALVCDEKTTAVRKHGRGFREFARPAAGGATRADCAHMRAIVRAVHFDRVSAAVADVQEPFVGRKADALRFLEVSGDRVDQGTVASARRSQHANTIVPLVGNKQPLRLAGGGHAAAHRTRAWTGQGKRTSTGAIGGTDGKDSLRAASVGAK